MYYNDLSNMQTSFQAGVDSIYNAVVAKGSTPASKSLSDVVKGINNIQTKTPIVIPTFANGASYSGGGAASSSLVVNTTGYTKLTIGSVSLPSSGRNSCTIIGNSTTLKTISGSTSNISINITGYTKITISTSSTTGVNVSNITIS